MDSKEYWRKREEENLKHNLKTEAEYLKTINSYYDYMMDQVQKEINGFYAKYARKEGITLAESKKRVLTADIEAYGRKAAKYVKEKDFSAEANAEMRLYNATMKINRLEMLKANIGLELVDGFDGLQKYFDKILTDRTLSEFERQAGILGKTIRDNEKAAHAIVNASFSNATYSDRIWMYQNMLKSDLSKLLQEGLIQGRNPRQLARHLTKRFGVSKSDAERLMITELTRVQADAQKQSYERNGYEKYKFLALNPGACAICKALDGKIFDVSDMMPGENAEPMHPRCHCSTAPYVDREELDRKIAFKEKGGTDEEWERMKNSEKSVEKSSKGGIIKSGAVSGARNPYGKAANKHAALYYGIVRSMTTDAKRIAETTGYSEQEIQIVKNYIFIDEHDLGDQGVKQFDPDYMMGESWRRLIEGKPEPHDLTLIHHEIMERKLIQEGMSQDEAHIKATEKYNYDKEAHKFYGKIKKFKKE